MAVSYTFYKNDGTSVSEQLPHMPATPFPDPAADFGWSVQGKTFKGWNTESDGSGTFYYTGDTIFTGTTFYAIWEAPAIKYLTTDRDLTSVANAIRAKSGGSASLAFPAGFVSAIQAIPSGGGGMTPPANAVAQFEVSILFSSQPGTISIDFSSAFQKMTGSRTYAWSLILWRDDVVSASSYSYLVDNFNFAGRISTGSCDANLANDVATAAGSMTSGTNLSSSNNLAASKSFSSGKETITLSSTTTRDRTGKFRGVFTVIAPWTDEYTGEKLTSCPANFLTYTAVS